MNGSSQSHVEQAPVLFILLLPMAIGVSRILGQVIGYVAVVIMITPEGILAVTGKLYFSRAGYIRSGSGGTVTGFPAYRVRRTTRISGGFTRVTTG